MSRKASIALTIFAAFSLIASLTALPTFAQQTVDNLSVEEIIRRFASKESELKEARKNYSFRQKVIIQTIGPGGQVTGEFRRDTEVVFDDSSNRREKIVYFPTPTLTEVVITPEDLHDLSGIQPFALTLDEVGKYDIKYLGKERIDELNTYVFEVKPKVMPDLRKSKERYLQGKIWVDDVDFQIVKVVGRGVPQGKQRFPLFETYRENIDDKYWFPTYTFADEVLHFESGQSSRVRMLIRYTDYKRFSGDIKIIGDGEIVKDKP